MYLTMVSGFSDFLSKRDRTLQEILDHLVRVVLVPLDVRSVLYIQTNDTNEYFVAGQSGITLAAVSELAPRYSLSNSNPFPDVIRYGKIIWLPNRPESLTRYPTIKDYPQLVGDRTMILLPIFSSGVPVAGLTLFSQMELENISHLESFLAALSSVLSLYFYKLNPTSSIEPSGINHSDSKISPDANS